MDSKLTLQGEVVGESLMEAVGSKAIDSKVPDLDIFLRKSQRHLTSVSAR